MIDKETYTKEELLQSVEDARMRIASGQYIPLEDVLQEMEVRMAAEPELEAV